MPNNKRILVPRKRALLKKLVREGKKDAKIRFLLGRPDLDVAWFRTWVK